MSAEQLPTDVIVESVESAQPQVDMSRAGSHPDIQIATRWVLQPLLLDQPVVEKPLRQQEQPTQPTQNSEAITPEEPRRRRKFDYAASKAGHAVIFGGGFKRRRS